MSKWAFLYEYGNGKRVYSCSKCGSTITVDSELTDKMNGEKFCYNCGERMDGENDKKEDFRKLTDELIDNMAKAESKAEKDRVQTAELKTIIDHYGSKAQRRQAVEEFSELIQAICKYERNNYTFGECEDDPEKYEKVENAYKNLLGEIADAIVMIEQLKIMVGERDRTKIENIIDEKIKRQLDRIEKEKRTAKND